MITTLVGPNTYLLSLELARRKEQFIKDWGDLAIEQVDGEEADYQRIYDSVTSLPFLVEKKLVILKNPGQNAEFVKSTETLVANLGDSTELIIVELKPDRRSSYFKMLSKLTELVEFSDGAESDLSGWLAALAKNENSEISRSDAQYLISLVGPNQMRLSNELQKLITYEPKVTRQNIDLLVEPTPQTTIFQLLDATFEGRSKEIMRIYQDQRAQSVEPQQIIAMLAWQLHVLALVCTTEGKNSSEIASTTKLNPFVIRKSQQVLSKIDIVGLRRTIRRVLKLDLDLKSKSVDADDSLLQLLLSIAN